MRRRRPSALLVILPLAQYAVCGRQRATGPAPEAAGPARTRIPSGAFLRSCDRRRGAVRSGHPIDHLQDEPESGLGTLPLVGASVAGPLITSDLGARWSSNGHVRETDGFCRGAAIG